MVWRLICVLLVLVLPALAVDTDNLTITDDDVQAITDGVVDGVVDVITPTEEELEQDAELQAEADQAAAEAQQAIIDGQTDTIVGAVNDAVGQSTDTVMAGLADMQADIIQSVSDGITGNSAGDGVATYDFGGASGSPYAGTISSTVLDLFDRLACRVGVGDDYVFFRGSQYSYYLYAGSDLSFTGSGFTGDGLVCWQLVTNNNYNGGYDLYYTDNVGLNLSVSGDDLVYSSLAFYPVLDSSLYVSVNSLLFCAILVCVSALIWRVLSFCLRMPRWVRRG